MISADLSRRLAAAVQTVSYETRTRAIEIIVSVDTDDEALTRLKNDPLTATIFQTGR